MYTVALAVETFPQTTIEVPLTVNDEPLPVTTSSPPCNVLWVPVGTAAGGQGQHRDYANRGKQAPLHTNSSDACTSLLLS